MRLHGMAVLMDRKDVPSSTSSHPAWGTDTPGAPSAVLKCQSVREGAAGLPSQTACGSRSQGAGTRPRATRSSTQKAAASDIRPSALFPQQPLEIEQSVPPTRLMCK